MDYNLGILLYLIIMYAVIVGTFISISSDDYYTVPKNLILELIHTDWYYDALLYAPIGTVLPGDVLQRNVFNKTLKVIKL